MIDLKEIVDFCNKRVRTNEISDFPGAENGLQFANNGKVSKIGAAVDAGLKPFEAAAEAGVDFLIVHHGMFWNPFYPITGSKYEKVSVLLKSNCAVYGSHLPLDAHPEIGNNAIIAEKLGLKIDKWVLEYEGNPIAATAQLPYDRAELSSRLKALFPDSYTAIEYGSDKPTKAAILSGSGRSMLAEMENVGADTLITGELRQEHFNFAQENKLNLYPCGHYATEVFGVMALAEEVAKQFDLPWEFIKTDCPL